MSQSHEQSDILGEALSKFEDRLQSNLQGNNLLFKEMSEATHALGEQINSISKKIDVVDKLVDLKIKHLDDVIKENREQTDKSIKLIQEEHFTQTEQISGLDRLIRLMRYWFVGGIILFLGLLWILDAHLQRISSGQFSALEQLNQQLIQSIQGYARQTNQSIMQSNRNIINSLQKEILSSTARSQAIQKKNQEMLVNLGKTYPEQIDQKNKELLEAIRKNNKDLMNVKRAKPKSSTRIKKASKLPPTPSSGQEEPSEKEAVSQEEVPAYAVDQNVEEAAPVRRDYFREEAPAEESQPVASPSYLEGESSY